MMDQIKLVADITKAVEKQGVNALNSRQVNAIIRAANEIITEIQAPHTMSAPKQGLAAWLRSDDTGLSSRFMARILASGPSAELAFPWDPSDFGRCYRFLRAVPDHLPLDLMETQGKVWAAMVKVWPKMEKLWEKESPTGKCPKLWDLMQKIIKENE